MGKQFERIEPNHHNFIMKILLVLLILSAPCFAEEPCGLRSMTDTTPLLYPPIARAAHVEGIVLRPVDSEPRPIEKKDIQHVTIYANELPVYTTYDPGGKRIKHFWIF